MPDAISAEQHQVMMSTKKTSFEEQMKENKELSIRSIVTVYPLEGMQRIFGDLLHHW